MSLIITTALFSVPTRTIRRQGDPNTQVFQSDLAIIDTGATRTVVPMSGAEQMGVRLSEQQVIPTAFGGQQIEGMVGRIRIELPMFRVSTEVDVLFADVDGNEVLIGTDFLARVGAVLTIGRKRLTFARKNPDEEGDFITALWRYSDEDLGD